MAAIDSAVDRTKVTTDSGLHVANPYHTDLFEWAPRVAPHGDTRSAIKAS